MTNKKPVSTPKTGLSRRNLLGVAATAPLGAVVAKATQASAASPQDHIDLSKSYPFYGQGPQAGIQTAPQRYSQFMAFNLTSLNPRDIQILLARWSAAIAQMMAGKPVGLVDPERDNAVVLETGEALDLGPASLTVTVGLGPKVFSDVKGLEDYKPPLMRSLHDLPGDALKAELSGGDLAVQACADDPQVTYHAVRILARIAKATGVASTRWAIMGFGRASAGPGQTTRAICSASATARATSPHRKIMTVLSGSRMAQNGSITAPIWSPARSACLSKVGTQTGLMTRMTCLGVSRYLALLFPESMNLTSPISKP